MNIQKHILTLLLLATFVSPLHTMDSGDREQGVINWFWNVAKENQVVTATLCVSALFVTYLLTKSKQGSSLTVYNMSNELIMDSYTEPVAMNSKNSKETCSIAPYQSYWDSHAVTYSLPKGCIQTCIWRHVCSPYYKAQVNLQEGEHATIEILHDGQYKFKGKILQAKLLTDV